MLQFYSSVWKVDFKKLYKLLKGREDFFSFFMGKEDKMSDYFSLVDLAELTASAPVLALKLRHCTPDTVSLSRLKTPGVSWETGTVEARTDIKQSLKTGWPSLH